MPSSRPIGKGGLSVSDNTDIEWFDYEPTKWSVTTGITVKQFRFDPDGVEHRRSFEGIKVAIFISNRTLKGAITQARAALDEIEKGVDDE